MQGRFIAVVGPSGVGKDSVMAALAARDPAAVGEGRLRLSEFSRRWHLLTS